MEIKFKSKQQMKEGEAQTPSLETKSQVIKEKKFYEKPWFWLCVVIMIACITRPIQLIICGNGNGNGCGSDDNKLNIN